jgi:hypothetical protein
MKSAAEIKRSIQTDPAAFFWLIALSSPESLKANMGGAVPQNATPEQVVAALTAMVNEGMYEDVFNTLRLTKLNIRKLTPQAQQAVKEMYSQANPVPMFQTTESADGWWNTIDWASIGKGAGDTIGPLDRDWETSP